MICTPTENNFWIFSFNDNVDEAYSRYAKRCYIEDSYKYDDLVTVWIGNGGLWDVEGGYDWIGHTNSSKDIAVALNITEENVLEARAYPNSDFRVFKIIFDELIDGHLTGRNILTIRDRRNPNKYLRVQLMRNISEAKVFADLLRTIHEREE